MAWPVCRPNPMVGALLVHDGRIVAEGYTQAPGGNHAEVECVKNITDRDLLSKATLYVSLEPCCHHGRTAPCTDLILEKGITKVVVACEDSNPQVAGQGIKKLRDAGVDVRVGVMSKEAQWMNRRFFTQQKEARPYVILKWAQTADGFVDKLRDSSEAPLKITGLLTNQISHLRRSNEMCILVGGETFRMDQPRLDVRHVEAVSPRRVVWTSMKETDAGYNHLRAESVDDVLAAMHQEGVQSVLVEGGTKVLQSFIDAKIYDELIVLKSSQVLGQGVMAPRL